MNKNCQVWNCKNESEYINPLSRLVYCQDCYDNLDGEINLGDGKFIKLIKIVKVE